MTDPLLPHAPQRPRAGWWRRRRAAGPQWVDDPWDDPSVGATAVERLRRGRWPFKWLAYTAMCLALVGLLVAGAVGLWYVRHVNPEGDPGAPINFTVTEGETLGDIAVRLEDAGLVSRAWLFEWYTKRHGGLEAVPGYYQLQPRDHMGNLLAVLRTPPEQTYSPVTFPEGYTLVQMAQRVERDVPLQQASEFLTLSTNGAVRSPFQPPEVTSLEGMLFPDTYQVAGNENEGQLIERMIALMERVGRQEDLEERAAAFGYTPYQVLTIASMIEKEAKVAEDRPLIARVIYNRLFLGMPLQIDATLFYGQDTDRPFSELRDLPSPYNTYLNLGLPPTPIANPGRASIQAALNPAPNPERNSDVCINLPEGIPCLWLYYVLADEDGHHAFGVTLEQHEANIAAAREAGVL